MVPWLLIEGKVGGTTCHHQHRAETGWIRPFQRVNHPKAGKHGGGGTFL